MYWTGPLIQDLLTTKNLESSLRPKTSGLYLWRRIQRRAPEAISDANKLLLWLNRGVESPLLKATDLRVRSPRDQGFLEVRDNFIVLEGIYVGRGRLPENKLEVLKTHVSDIDAAQELHEFIHESTIKFGPVLYVGESDCLQSRLTNHLGEGSVLRERLADLNLELEDVALFYAPTPDLSSDVRKLYESLLTHLLVAPLTYRAG